LHSLDNTPRLYYTAIEHSDALELYKGAFSHSSITEYLQWECHKSLTETEALVNQMVQLHKSGGKQFWVARSIQLGSLVGLGSMQNETDTSNIGFLVCTNHQRQGYATEIIDALCHRAILTGHIVRALVKPLNTPSSELLESLGWARSGVEEALNVYVIK